MTHNLFFENPSPCISADQLKNTEPEYPDDVAFVLGSARDGDSVAQKQIYSVFVDQLVAIASRRINERFRSKIAPEEIVQSVFASFFKRNDRREFQFEDWNDLWALLVKITVRKSINRVNRFKSSKRDIRKERRQSEKQSNSSFFGAERQPSPHELVIFNECLDQLFDALTEKQQQIVCLRLQGWSNFEICEQLN
jgi:RNA polymerase sigma factor (sigma-70 family)